MTTFEQSEWYDPELARAYRDQADHLVQDRQRLLSLLGLFYRELIMNHSGKEVLDLGCGDGILSETLKLVDGSIRLSAWDGSKDMLGAARERLSRWSNVNFQMITFQEILTRTDFQPRYDFIVSSFAIHHVRHEEKRALFAQIHQLLRKDGYFINVDTIMPDHRIYEDYYDEIWRDWLTCRKEKYDLDEEILSTPERAKAKPENLYEPLSIQLRFLEEVGFDDVECFYKAGMFSMYGGRKI